MIFANGAKADFRGENNTHFAFVSYPGLALNIKIQEATFVYRNTTVDGTFMTAAYMTGRTESNTTVKFAHSAFRANRDNWGWKMVELYCGPKHMYVFPHFTRHCDDFHVSVDVSSSRVQFKQWKFEFRTNKVFRRKNGTEHRLDVKLNGPKTPVSHGILGQSFNTNEHVPNGKQDVYPTNSVQRFRTSAQAEGSIEGDHTDYIVKDPFDVHFKFGRFDGELDTEETFEHVDAGAVEMYNDEDVDE